MTATPWPMQVGSLVLREAGPVDIDRLLTFRTDPAVNRFMLHTTVDPEKFRKDWLAVPDSDADFSCVAELDGTVVAMGFLEIVDGSGQPGVPKGTEGLIGYIVDPAFAGRGVASDLSRGLLTAAFDVLGLRRVRAGCYADNLASVRVLEKTGMRREQHGIEDSWHAELGWVDGYEYGILAREWRAQQQAGASSAAPTQRSRPVSGDNDAPHGRRVVANLALSMDGSYHGAGGPDDFALIAPYAVTDVARNHMARFISTATTAVLGRVGAEGFLGFWPNVVGADGVDPRDEAYARWLVDTEKVVLSTTLTEAPGRNSRVHHGPATDAIAELRQVGEGDILVNSSPSVIKQLLAADAIDRLELLVVPEVAGGGARLFEHGVPATTWTLSGHGVGELGELSLTYDRVR